MVCSGFKTEAGKLLINSACCLSNITTFYLLYNVLTMLLMPPNKSISIFEVGSFSSQMTKVIIHTIEIYLQTKYLPLIQPTKEENKKTQYILIVAFPFSACHYTVLALRRHRRQHKHTSAAAIGSTLGRQCAASHIRGESIVLWCWFNIDHKLMNLTIA